MNRETPMEPESMNPTLDTGPTTVTRAEFARMLRVGTATFDRHRDQLPSPIRLGRRLLWSRSAVLEYLNGKKAS